MCVFFRECDPDGEKGSASTSLRKSILGPSLSQQSQIRTNNNPAPISKVNTSMANMAIVGNLVPQQTLSSGSYPGINSDSDSDLWESLGMSNSPMGNTGNMNVNDIPTSSSTSFINQLRGSQLQRSISTQPRNPGLIPKRPGNLAQYGQRSSSLDQGQMHPVNMGGGQKSPAVAVSPGAAVRNGNFPFPVQRGPMGYNRRSPAASPSQGFNAPFPPRTPSPMLSPSPGKFLSYSLTIMLFKLLFDV